MQRCKNIFKKDVNKVKNVLRLANTNTDRNEIMQKVYDDDSPELNVSVNVNNICKSINDVCNSLIEEENIQRIRPQK